MGYRFSNFGDFNDYNQGFSREKLILIFIVLVIILIAVAITYYAIPEIMSSKLLKVIRYNVGFWIILFIATIFGFYRKLTNPNNFTWAELPIQLTASTLTIIFLYMIFFFTAGKLGDKEILNGYVQQAEYYEEWTELVTYTEQEACGTDSNGNTQYRTVTKTRHDYHPPTWNLLTTVGEININKSTYNNYISYWGDEKKKKLFHANQISIGDGDMYFCKYSGKNDEKLIPASTDHLFINYLKASDSIRKVSGQISGFKDLLLPYPQIHSEKFGPIEVNRVLDARTKTPQAWQKELDKLLDRSLTVLGPSKQVNILVYIAKTSDPQFGYALEEYWIRGKKNDVIVVLGMDQFPKINFVHIIAWTKVEEFPIMLRNKLMELSDVSDAKQVASIITDQISASPNSGGFLRMPMSDLEYLIKDIRLPLWCQIMIVVVGSAVSFGISVYLVRNDVL